MNTAKNGVHTPSTNGNSTKPADTPKNGTTVKTTVPVVSLPAKPTGNEKVNDEHAPLEDRILKIQILGDLVSKREKLHDSLKKINSFKFSSDSRQDTLTIEDGNNNEFSTSNTDVLKDVVSTIKATIQKKIVDVNEQLVF